jgi:hypothetical protein
VDRHGSPLRSQGRNRGGNPDEEATEVVSEHVQNIGMPEPGVKDEN